MKEKDLLVLGFRNNSWQHDGNSFTEFVIGNGELGILISGISLVEITQGKGIFITVPNCKTIEDLKELMRLFGLKNIEK